MSGGRQDATAIGPHLRAISGKDRAWQEPGSGIASSRAISNRRSHATSTSQIASSGVFPRAGGSAG